MDPFGERSLRLHESSVVALRFGAPGVVISRPPALIHAVIAAALLRALAHTTT